MYIRFVKPAIGYLLALIALPFWCLIAIPISIAIKMEDGGPVFYMAGRIGKDNKIFKMFKFRSMKVNAPVMYSADGSTYSAADDPRVTRVGKILRSTSLDETAQVLNILTGDMALIGPRASGTDSIGTFLSDEEDKMKVKPGITGYCQAYYRNSATAREKRLKDAWYANNVTFWLDVKIFFKTIVTVLKRENVYTD